MTRVWCIGAGEIGSVIAARLARAGVEVTVLDADSDHVSRLRDPGLEVAGTGGGIPTPIAAHSPTDAAALAAPDLVLLSGRTEGAERLLGPVLPNLPDTADVVCLQGAEPGEVAAAIGAHRTINATVGFTSSWLGPGRVSLDAPGDVTIARLDGSTDARLESARQVLGHAFPTTIAQGAQDASVSVQEAAPTVAPQATAVPGPFVSHGTASEAPTKEATPTETSMTVSKARRSRAWLLLPLLLAAALVFLVVRVFGGPDSPPGPPGADPGSAPDRTAAPQATPSVAGKSIQTVDGNTLTVYSAESPAEPNREVVIAAEEGMQLAAVDAEFCVREDFGASGTVSENQFRVELENEKRVGFWDTPDYVKDPRFATQTVEPGDCGRGWITFQVPKDQEITKVHWTPAKDSPEVLEWDVSEG